MDEADFENMVVEAPQFNYAQGMATVEIHTPFTRFIVKTTIKHQTT
jgi:hypothetical protein